ncbi:sulfatase family protein [Pontiella sulfatireligans]|uniref:Arylsulfatase n=1 Tax=Pontiella sulfatireligans TaxID=2750658 RepID=A0A6C2UP55_9BACT|nr:sulfatase-like hydrolase/transferase [Pontiella sulfatireligans]SPS74481.1 sulfatase S1_44 [Kiritimatiellales bacterium]VGO21978.1 Arylsulfatase [Pontiella sulfatireligans]
MIRNRIKCSVCAAWMMGVVSVQASVDGASRSPNVIVCLVDDMGVAHINVQYETYTIEDLNQGLVERDIESGSYTLDQSLEAAKKSMPFLHGLIEAGVRFTDAHVANSLCAPSRAGLLTGRYPQKMGIYHNGDIEAKGLPADATVLPKLFQQAGYTTACIGKWHVAKHIPGNWDGSIPDPAQQPTELGFDTYFGLNRSGTVYYNSTQLFRGTERAAAKGFITDQLTDESDQFIKGAGEKPFMLYLAYTAPHGPLDQLAPATYDAPFAHLPRRLRIWNSYMYAVDCGIKKLFETVKAEGELDNTLFIFLSDNGACGNTPLPANGLNRGYKGTHYTGGTRTAMMMWGPEWVKKKSKCSHLVSAMDVFPTALDIAGIERPEALDLDGKSLAGLIGGKSQVPVHNSLVWASKSPPHWSHVPNGLGGRDMNKKTPAVWTVRSGKWVLRTFAQDGHYELFDYQKDIGETKDLSRSNPETVQNLKKVYADWFRSVKPPLDWDRRAWSGLIPEEMRTVADNEKVRQYNEQAKEFEKQSAEWWQKLWEEKYDPNRKRK